VKRLGLIVALAAVLAPAASARHERADPACSRPAIGMMAPLTGDSAAIGADQLHWAQFFLSRWNASHRRKVRLIDLDTQLNPTLAAVGAEIVANTTVLGMVIGGRSHEIAAAAPVLKRAGLAILSGSATKDSLTAGGLRGYFFRVVPRDSLQASSDVDFMQSRLRVKRGSRVAVVDDGSAYGRGLADAVQRALRSRDVRVQRLAGSQTAADFGPLVGRIGKDVRVLFAPWQVPQQAQQFAAAVRAARRSVVFFGGDGVFDPAHFTAEGAYVSFFAPDLTTVRGQAKLVADFRRRYGDTGPFGPPNWVATQVLVRAIDRSCRDGRTSRAEVRRFVARTKLRQTILGRPLAFTRSGDIVGGRFAVYRIVNGRYVTIR
jgi:branched-chain amino acid transport system substrate-binding protein